MPVTVVRFNLVEPDATPASLAARYRAAVRMAAYADEHGITTVQTEEHHGAENNIDQDFCDAVTADHYVFCGNGFQGNPDPRVLDLIVRRRLAAAGTARFKFWFTSSTAVAHPQSRKDHMKRVEQKVNQLQTLSHGRLRKRFLTSGNSLRIL